MAEKNILLPGGTLIELSVAFVLNHNDDHSVGVSRVFGKTL